MEIAIRLLNDMHYHARQGDELEQHIALEAPYYGYFNVMPNLRPAPVLKLSQALDYKSDIMRRMKRLDRAGIPCPTIQITEETTPETVRIAAMGGIWAGKVYPFGVTNNSDNGVKDFDRLDPALAAMEEHRMIALFHGEYPGDMYGLDREMYFFRRIAPKLVRKFPNLKIVFEHLSTKSGVKFVLRAPANVAATITVHHLFLTTDDVLGGRTDELGNKLQPHNFCKPVAKRESDRLALLRAATSGNPKFFLGTDSALHDVSAKECSHGCAGTYVPAEVAIPSLVQQFSKAKGWIRKLDAFASENSARFYGLPLNTETLIVKEEEWQVPDRYHNVVPFRAGQVLPYKVIGRGKIAAL